MLYGEFNYEENGKLKFYAVLVDRLVKNEGKLGRINLLNPVFEYRVGYEESYSVFLTPVGRVDLALISNDFSPIAFLEFKGGGGTCYRAWEQLLEYSRYSSSCIYACIIANGLESSIDSYHLEIRDNPLNIRNILEKDYTNEIPLVDDFLKVAREFSGCRKSKNPLAEWLFRDSLKKEPFIKNLKWQEYS